MKIVQSSWSCNQLDLLRFNAGWYSPEYNLMSWTLSCLQLKKYYAEVILYADSVAAEILIDTLKLPYTEVVCNLDKLNIIHPQLWALPKIYSYSQQDTPFLHVDGDVFIWKPFDDNLLKKELITQNLEVSTDYYETHMKALEAKLIYFPSEIIVERKNTNPIYAYNAGIFGGCDIAFFQEYTQKAIGFIKKNESSFSKIDVGVFNIFFEQYLFYVLVKKYKKKVGVLLDEVIGDNEYVGFGDFTAVPYNKQYLHVLGVFKRDKTVCEQMADRLRLDYPEYYYRIINLFKKNRIPLKKDYYHFIDNPSERGLTDRYALLKTKFKKNELMVLVNPKLGEGCKLNLSSNLMKTVSATIEHVEKNFQNEELSNELRKDILLFEAKLDILLNQKFIHYSQEYLYGRDLNYTQYFQLIFEYPKLGFDIKLIADPLLEIVECKYNWNEVYQSYVDQTIIKSQLNTEPSDVYTAIIPECDLQGYSLINMDDLDLLLIQNLKKLFSINELLNEVKQSFDPIDLENSLAEFEILILGRIKRLLQTKIIKVIF
ncbi:DUF6734 family protein [uncultured Mucilaginibacter sp.]|uniref:DUF6734 family protein n=1 Tax=uncultured Mucilaginibacter sp. TaxID=797541 RepID=UPI0026122E11|nr:DUF6734 family protein [uncultured Mucilaginibacter sp.]